MRSISLEPPVASEAVTNVVRPIAPALALTGVLLSVVAALTARRRAVARVILAAACSFVVAAAFIEQRSMRLPATASAAAIGTDQPGPPRLATALGLRRAVTSGAGNVEAAFASIDRRGGRGAIADLWRAQSLLMQSDVEKAKKALANFPSPSERPLAEMLRARVALLENDEVAAVVAFENAINLGPGRDAFWYEAAEALFALGFEQRAAGYFKRLARIGSRDPDVYYALAVLAAYDRREDEAEEYLRRAWSMRPLEREQLVSSGAFWSLLRRPGIAELIGFGAASELRLVSAQVSSRAIPLSSSADPRTSGDFLQVEVGDRRLLVPGGAPLAPPGTIAVEATAWREAEESRRLEDLPSLLGGNTNAAAFAQPALRQKLTATAHALAARNRWQDLVQLTDGLSPSAGHVPPSIFFMRSVGLQRLDRLDEAKRLLGQVAGSSTLQRRRDADAFVQLAELFAGHDLFDAAVRMYDHAQSIRANPFIDDRVRQIQMNKRLATKYSTHATEHFDIHFPEDVRLGSAMEIGTRLEAELQRLQAFIPTPSFRKVVVNVVWWEDFRATYAGSDFVLGFYNGKITVPFAGVSIENPFVGGILAHELAHAMIAQATGDQAPRWFHEGLAQRIEERPYHGNAFNMYDDGKMLPVALLDSVLRGSPDPEMISAAYIVAQTDMRYIEEKYGRKAFASMMASFRVGATTDEAIRKLSGKSLSEFETDLRVWGRADRRVFQNVRSR